MTGVFRKAQKWLGLAPDDEYDDYVYEDPAPPRAPRRPGPAGPGPRPGPGPGAGRPRAVPDLDDESEVPRGPSATGPSQSGSVRTLPPSRPQRPERPEPERPRRPEGSRQPSSTPTVRPMRPSSARPTVLTPTRFDEAKEVADRFKAEQPVVMDISNVDRDLSRRLIDFSSGMCYSLGGHMERLRSGVYLLTPPNVEVSDSEKKRLAGS